MKFISVNHRIYVQSRTAGEKGPAAAPYDIVHCLIGKLLEMRHREKIIGTSHIEQMMGIVNPFYGIIPKFASNLIFHESRRYCSNIKN